MAGLNLGVGLSRGSVAVRFERLLDRDREGVASSDPRLSTSSSPAEDPETACYNISGRSIIRSLISIDLHRKCKDTEKAVFSTWKC